MMTAHRCAHRLPLTHLEKRTLWLIGAFSAIVLYGFVRDALGVPLP